jgi:ankyrin repeat protein
MNTNSMHGAARWSAPYGHSWPGWNVGDQSGRKDGWTRVGLLILFSALVVTAAGQVRADAYEEFNRAIATDDARTVTRLLERGMDPNTVNEKGEPALMTAAREGSPTVLKALIQARVKVNAKNGYGDTAIMIAALNGNLAVIKLLREAGAEINHAGWTPLQYAAINGHNAVIEYLISTGADLALTAPNGATPLMLAVLSNKAETVKLLISYGFDVGTRNDKGETALAWARRKEYKEIGEILRRAGAKE